MNTPIPPLIPAGSNILGNNLIGPTIIGTNLSPENVKIYGDATSKISLGNGTIVLDGSQNIISTNGEISTNELYSTNHTSLASNGPLGFFGTPAVMQQTFVTPPPTDLPTTIARLNEVTTILYNFGLTSNF